MTETDVFGLPEETDPFIVGICDLNSESVAHEMYERAIEREELLPWAASWDDLDEDEKDMRTEFVVECLNVAINQYRSVT